MAFDHLNIFQLIFLVQEETTVKDALMQHADLKDTSMWAGRSKPRNWASQAPRPDWYAEMLSHTADPLQGLRDHIVGGDRPRLISSTPPLDVRATVPHAYGQLVVVAHGLVVS